MAKADVVPMKVRRRPAAEAAPAPEPSAKKKAAPKAAAAPVGNRFTGATTGLGVTEFQNQTLAQNFKKKLTDEQLAALWRKEFPNAIAQYTVEHVQGVRRLFNSGNHKNEAPAKPLHPYDEAGNELPNWGDKKRAREAEAEVKQTTSAKAAGKAAAAAAAPKIRRAKAVSE